MGLLALLLVIAAPVAESRGLRLRLDPAVRCPGGAELESALVAELGSGVIEGFDSQSGAALLEVFQTGSGGLSARLSEGTAVVAERTLTEDNGTCADRARAIALLVKSWLRDLAPPPSHESSSATPMPSNGAVQRTTPSPAAVGTSAVVGERPPAQSNVPSLAVNLAAQATLGGGAALGATLGLEVSVARRLAVGMQVSLVGSLNASSAGGASATVDRQLVALYAAFLLIPPVSESSPTLAVLGGVTLLHYAAQSQGSSAAGWEPGLLLGVRGVLPLFQSVFLYGEVDGNAVANALNFQVAEGGSGSAMTTVLSQPVFWPSFSVGVGAHFL